MSTQLIRQVMFTAGEVDIQTWKRTDQAAYITAAQALTNAEVGTTGLVRKRKGMTVWSNVTSYANGTSKLYELIDENNVHYLVIAIDSIFNIFLNGVLFGSPVPMPYTFTDIPDLDYTQDGDSLVFTHPDYAPARLYAASYAGSVPTFEFQYLNIYPLPSYDYNTINYNAFVVSLVPTGTNLAFRFSNMGPVSPGYDNSWIGGEIVGAGSSTTEPVAYGIITAVGPFDGGTDMGTQTFTVSMLIPFQTTGGLYAVSGSQYSVRQPVWVSPPVWPAVNPVVSGYPAKVLFFQNRLWFANTNTLPGTVFGSKINTPISFDVGTGKDSDAIIYTIGQTNAGQILWMNGGKQLEIFCENNEFACPQDQNSALVPSTFAIRQQSSYGSSFILKPVTYINDSYFASRTGMAFINFHFNGVGLAYVSSNISIQSSHLVKSPINRALLQSSDSSQDNFVYFLNRTDNTITALQFALSGTQSQYTLAAMTPVIFEDDVALVDIVSVNNIIYVLKLYSRTSQYVLEYFDDTTRIDCNQPFSMALDGTITGITILDGYIVQVTYQNQDLGQYVVAGGTITVDNPLGMSATVNIGLLYDLTITPMYPFGGAQASPLKKQVQRIYVDYYNSDNFNINGQLVPYQFYPMYNGKTIEPVTGTAIVASFSGWNRFDNEGVPIISITQSSPFDLQILGIGYQIADAVL